MGSLGKEDIVHPFLCDLLMHGQTTFSPSEPTEAMGSTAEGEILQPGKKAVVKRRATTRQGAFIVHLHSTALTYIGMESRNPRTKGSRLAALMRCRPSPELGALVEPSSTRTRP